MTFVRHFTSTTQTPDEIHALGLAEIERISGEMETVAAQAGFAGISPVTASISAPTGR